MAAVSRGLYNKDVPAGCTFFPPAMVNRDEGFYGPGTGQVTELDILNAIHSISSPAMDSLMLGITYAATSGILWFGIALSMVCMRKHRRAGVVLIVTVAAAYIVCDVLIKPVIGRTRPCEFADFEMLVPVPDTYSFPSGHTMSSFAAATVLALAFRRWAPLPLLFACLVGLSRMYLFVHWPTDVLAGALLGVFVALVSVYLFRAGGYLDLRKKDEGD